VNGPWEDETPKLGGLVRDRKLDFLVKHGKTPSPDHDCTYPFIVANFGNDDPEACAKVFRGVS
jgi:hypothetical protein